MALDIDGETKRKRVWVQQEEYSFMSGTSMMTMYQHSQIMNAILYQLREFIKVVIDL
jgi:hypothetical protein